MTDSTITIKLPSFATASTAPAAKLSARLERIVERNLDAQTQATLFSFGIAAFALVIALGLGR